MDEIEKHGCLFYHLFAVVAIALFVSYYLGMRRYTDTIFAGFSSLEEVISALSGRDIESRDDAIGQFAPYPTGVIVTEIESDELEDAVVCGLRIEDKLNGVARTEFELHQAARNWIEQHALPKEEPYSD